MPIVLQVYNTLSRKIEPFEPVNSGKVLMYVCGPTVYDYSHMGHARTYVAFDVIRRYLRLMGYDVLYVQNITDIDDKIISRARNEGVDWREIVDKYTKDYLDALDKLNIKVDIHPRVSEHINEIINFIQILIDKGFAYVAPSGSVYFNVDMFEDYGKLSGYKEKSLWDQGEYVEEKRHPYDFALWKAAKPGEPWWESPWGRGRPGWHIECSVMSTKYLGKQFDIHGGGTDLIFPHHENEIAQSEAALGLKPWVKYWLHTGMLTIKGEKMSKSLRNIFTLREAFKKWKPEVIRLWLAKAHYRKILSFSEESLYEAEKLYNKLANAVNMLKKIIKENISFKLDEDQIKTLRELSNVRKEFYKAMNDDFNTSLAFSQMVRLSTIAFKEIIPSENYTLAVKALQLFEEFNKIFGVLDSHLHEVGIFANINELVDLIVEVRSILRKEKRYELTDYIRDKLNSLGIKLYDEKEKTTWRFY